MCWSPYSLQLYLKETSTQVFFCEYCGIFTNSTFYRTPPVAAFVSVISCSVKGTCRSSLLNQEHNVGWFLLKRFKDLVIVSSLLNQEHNAGWFLLKRIKDLVIVCHLHIISRNHSNMLLLIKSAETKQKLVQRKHCSKGYLL